MPLFDLFGLGKSGAKAEEKKEEEELIGVPEPAEDPPEKKPPAGRSKRFWGALLAADALILLLCLSLAGVGVYSHLGAQPSAVKSAKGKKKAREKPQAKIPAQEQKKTEAPPQKEKPKPAPAKPKEPAAKAAAAAKPEKGKRTTQPITFSYPNEEITEAIADAKKVSLVGMFLISSGGSKPTFKNNEGVWQVTIYLKIGVKYRYQFEVIDKEGGKVLTPVQTKEVL